ncbi:hypothetical protein EPYR_00713 [Erwinia pyrifoliae DSM 12163]|nr:hypothetical protein EPYR_00713 [Erwinia pyrifoliae DSM 12163]
MSGHRLSISDGCDSAVNSGAIRPAGDINIVFLPQKGALNSGSEAGSVASQPAAAPAGDAADNHAASPIT